MATKLCDECIEFFKIDVPREAFFLYSTDRCEGCFQSKETTNPNYWLTLLEKKKRSWEVLKLDPCILDEKAVVH